MTAPPAATGSPNGHITKSHAADVDANFRGNTREPERSQNVHIDYLIQWNDLTGCLDFSGFKENVLLIATYPRFNVYSHFLLVMMFIAGNSVSGLHKRASRTRCLIAD